MITYLATRAGVAATVLLLVTGVACEPTPDWAELDPTPLPTASGWVPVDCPEDFREDPLDPPPAGSLTAEYQESIPYPDPATRGEVIEDFEHGYFRLFHRRPPPARDPERPVYRTLREGRAVYEVNKITNWSSRRCGRRFAPFYFVVQVLRQDGTEIGRATVGADGAIGGYAGGGPGRPFAPLLAPEEARAILGSLGVEEPRMAQMAGLDGLHGRCGRSNPCLVAQAEGSIWVIYPGESAWIYEIPPDAARLSHREAAQLRLRGSLGLADLCCSDPERPLLSIGDAWAWAVRRAGESPHSDQAAEPG